jgi:transposase
MKSKTSIILLSLAAGIVLSALGGCASVGSTNTESLLSAAGFIVRTPETPKQKQIYATLPAYKVHRATVNDKVFYVYKDEKAGVAYVGHEPEYQRYKQLAVQQQIAQDQYMAAELDRESALQWYGGFGIRRIWW